jgi:hypothetical protein
VCNLGSSDDVQPVLEDVEDEMAGDRRRRLLLVAGAIAALVTGCAGTATSLIEQPELAAMEEYGCGYGFWLGSPDGRLAVRFAADNELAAGGELPREVSLPDAAWDATVLIGEDLYANWCDDVLEPGEPEPVVAETWPITAGTIRVETPAAPAGCPSEARATVADLEATRPDGTVVELGTRQLANDTWGCFAG